MIMLFLNLFYIEGYIIRIHVTRKHFGQIMLNPNIYANILYISLHEGKNREKKPHMFTLPYDIICCVIALNPWTFFRFFLLAYNYRKGIYCVYELEEPNQGTPVCIPDYFVYEIFAYLNIIIIIFGKKNQTKKSRGLYRF